MKREDIEHLATLARIELSEAEIERFSTEFDAILEYVGAVKGLAKDVPAEPALGPLSNVFREDKDPHAPGIFTEDLLNLAPDRDRGYVRVKKIIDK